MTYRNAIKYLGSFINYEKIPAYPYKESLKLERIRNLLRKIGNPQHSLRCVHIAGTKGKGSTCAFIAYCLRQAGYKTGLYTSPHLSDFRERIRILSPYPGCKSACLDFEGMISRQELADLVRTFQPAIEKYNRNCAYGPLSFFEACTALAFVYFKEQGVDFAVLETGLGGRLDATNVVEPLICAITPISYEHTQILGNTLQEIAAEKTGIIKPGAVVISAPQEKEAASVIKQKCKVTGAKLYAVGRQITYRKTGTGFNVKGVKAKFSGLKIGLIGEHQLVNASVAIGVIEALRHYGINIGNTAVKEGLSQALWPGRCEVVANRPLVVLDGAQNAASAKALRETIQNSFKYKKLILVLGISSDKDIKGICAQVYRLADEVILTRADNPRAMLPEALAKYFPRRAVHLSSGVRQAAELALRLAGIEDLILCTGSLFVVGEAREWAQKKLQREDFLYA